MALACLVCVSTVMAVENSNPITPIESVSQGNQQLISTTNTAYGTYFGPEDATTAPADPAGDVEVSCDCNGGNDCGCDDCCRKRLICDSCPLECDDCEPWRLFPCGHGPCGRLDVRGWIDAGATVADGNPNSDFNGPLTFNDRNDQLMMNQAYLIMERAIDNCGCGFDWGGRIDLLYGTDHRFTMARGLETTGAFGPKWNSGGSNMYGVALPQAYAEIAYNDFSAKIGHYYTIIGYEVVPALPNFFYSHAYTMQYGEPFTHTGFLGSYQANDNLQLLGGIDRGWDNWEDDNANESALWGALWDSGEGTTLAATGTFGKELNFVGANTQRTLMSFVGGREITSRLSYVIQSDIGHQNSGGGFQSAEWYGVNQYLFYKLNCCWTLGARMEWFRDDDGVRVTGLGVNNPIAGSAYAGDFFEATLGANWTPRGNTNLMIRPEVRYDAFDGVSTAGTALPFDDGTDSKMWTAAIDVIFQF